MWCLQSVMRVKAVNQLSNSSHSRIARFFSSKAPSVTLYQYAICPFCHKAKALLAYSGIQYDVVEVNPLTKAELKPWSGDYRKVPIALVDGKQVNGSEEIISALLENPNVAASLENKWNTMTMDEFRFSPSALQWSKTANDDLAALLYPNIARTLSDSYRAFTYVDTVDSFSWMQKMSIRLLGSLATHFAASKIKSKRGIDDEQKALDDALSAYEEEALGQGKLFASGTDEPNLGDLTMFGTLRSVEGLPAHTEAVEGRGGKLSAWYNRMKEQVYNEKDE